MAIVHFVKSKRTQTVGGLNAVINYCCKDAKVSYEGRPLVTGINCVPQVAYALNDMHIPARKGEWSQTSIVNILTNEVYLGKIRWRSEPVKKVVKDGPCKDPHPER